MADKQVTVAVPEERVPEFYAWFASFLAAEPGAPPPLAGRRPPRLAGSPRPAHHLKPGRRRTPTRPSGCIASWRPRPASCLTYSPPHRAHESPARKSPSASSSRRELTESRASSPYGPAATAAISIARSRSLPKTPRRRHRLLHGPRARRTLHRRSRLLTTEPRSPPPPPTLTTAANSRGPTVWSSHHRGAPRGPRVADTAEAVSEALSSGWGAGSDPRTSTGPPAQDRPARAQGRDDHGVRCRRCLRTRA